MQNHTSPLYLILNSLFILFALIFIGCNSLSKNETLVSIHEVEKHNHSKSLNANDSIGSPQMKFDQTTLYLDTIQKGENAEIEYQFTNTGTAPLLIEETFPSCGCTTPDYPTSKIFPGEYGQILLKFESKNKEGLQNLYLTVVTNTYEKYYLLRFVIYVKS